MHMIGRFKSVLYTYIHTYIHTHVHTHRGSLVRGMVPGSTLSEDPGMSDSCCAHIHTYTHTHTYIHTHRGSPVRSIVPGSTLSEIRACQIDAVHTMLDSLYLRTLSSGKGSPNLLGNFMQAIAVSVYVCMNVYVCVCVLRTLWSGTGSPNLMESLCKRLLSVYVCMNVYMCMCVCVLGTLSSGKVSTMLIGNFVQAIAVSVYVCMNVYVCMYVSM